jgi:nicotinamidase/pyrazinamidase
LRDRGLRRIFLAGLATDFCVHYSAVDARRLRFDTVLVEAGCRAIDLAGSLDAAWAGMAAIGVQRVDDLWCEPSRLSNLPAGLDPVERAGNPDADAQ